MPARRSSLHGAQAQIGARGARFQHARQACAQGCDAQIYGKAGVLGNASQQVHVAQHLVGFRGDRDAQSFALGHLLKDRARGAEFALGRLVRIGGGSDGDVLALNLFHAQVAAGERAGILLDVNFLLEVGAVQLHVFVRVTRVAILAAEFAAAIGIHRPGKRHASRVAMIQDRSHGQQEIFRAALGVSQRGGEGETGDADAFGRGPWWQQGIRPAVPLVRDVGEKGGCGIAPAAARNLPSERKVLERP